jgi:dsDNA-specific endonuclease/ATPase MutS2
MNKSEIFDFQMASFEKKLDLAIMQKSPSILFIHGIGEGRLRNEIHESLKVRNEVKSFVNQYHPFYGYGATEVFLK